MPRSRPTLLAAQVEEQATRAARPGRRAARRRRPRPTSSARSVAQVQQQIQVLAADQRNIEEQIRQLNQRRERLRGRPQRAGRARRGAPGQPAGAAGRRAGSRRDSRRAPARAAGAGAAARRRPPHAGSRPSTPKARRQADLSARMEALKALQEKVTTDGKLAALAGQARPRRPAGPVEPHPHRAGLGERAGSGAARAPGLAGGLAAGHGARLRQRRAAGQAGLLQPAAGRRRRKPPARCRAWPTCCA